VVYYIGVDGGGTFTDCAAMDEHGRLHYAKAATTKDDFAVGMFEALSVLADECDTTVPELISATERFSLGTTVGTNSLVERRERVRVCWLQPGMGMPSSSCGAQGVRPGSSWSIRSTRRPRNKPALWCPVLSSRRSPSAWTAWARKWSRSTKRRWKPRCGASSKCTR